MMALHTLTHHTVLPVSVADIALADAAIDLANQAAELSETYADMDAWRALALEAMAQLADACQRIESKQRTIQSQNDQIRQLLGEPFDDEHRA